MARRDEKELVDRKMPVEPDPFWPTGVTPSHLPSEASSKSEIVDKFIETVGVTWRCEKCGRIDQQSLTDKRYCHDCYSKEVQNTALAKRVNANWMDEAEELGLKIFERQPEETDKEWFIWTRYREYYPLKLPTWSELATMCGTSVANVVNTANKWSFKTRLVAWAQFTDEAVQEERIVAIREMNQKQLTMAKTIQEKLGTAISAIQPETLKPNEIVNLFKVATELERKVTTYVEEKVGSEGSELRKKQTSITRPEDIGEIAQILQSVGIFDKKAIGVEQTTRIIINDNGD